MALSFFLFSFYFIKVLKKCFSFVNSKPQFSQYISGLSNAFCKPFYLESSTTRPKSIKHNGSSTQHTFYVIRYILFIIW